jgi:uncharacterized membrane protein YcaP (DUF421 family)
MDSDAMFFNSWDALRRTAVVAIFAYVGLILFLRISGKRTLAKMNAFDFVVTVALGSTLASILLSNTVSLAQGLLALALLIALQYVVAWSSVRSRWFRRLLKSEPTLLVRRGEILDQALRRERISTDEVLAAIRAYGVQSLGSVEAVVLETDGSFSVIPRRENERDVSALGNVPDANDIA